MQYLIFYCSIINDPLTEVYFSNGLDTQSNYPTLPILLISKQLQGYLCVFQEPLKQGSHQCGNSTKMYITSSLALLPHPYLRTLKIPAIFPPKFHLSPLFPYIHATIISHLPSNRPHSPPPWYNGHLLSLQKRLSDIFILKVDNNFCLLEMDRQESYISADFDYEGDNFLSHLFNDSTSRKELLNLGDSTDLKEYGLMLEDYLQPEIHSPNYKDILDKQEYNCPLPQNLYQEHGDQSILILSHTSKHQPSEMQTASKKEYKVDKLAYQEETRANKIQRYRQKKSRRIWDRKVFYDCRKVVADNRQRVNGRFVKKSPLLIEKSNTHKNSLATEQLQIIKDFNEMYRNDLANFVLE